MSDHARRIPVALLAAALVALVPRGAGGRSGSGARRRIAVPARPGAALRATAAAPALETRRGRHADPGSAPRDARTVLSPRLAAAPTRDGWSVLMTETFEGVWPQPGLWTAFDNDGAHQRRVLLGRRRLQAATPEAGAPGRPTAGPTGSTPTYSYYPAQHGLLDGLRALRPQRRQPGQPRLLVLEPERAGTTTGSSGAHSGDGIDFDGTQVSGDSGGWQHVSSRPRRLAWATPSVWIAFVFNSDGSHYGRRPVRGRHHPERLLRRGDPARGLQQDRAGERGYRPAVEPRLCRGGLRREPPPTSTATTPATTTPAAAPGRAPAPPPPPTWPAWRTSTTYYWQVRANNGAGTTYADGASTAYWNFTTTAPRRPGTGPTWSTSTATTTSSRPR